MISAYFDVKPRKAASVPVRPVAGQEVFKPSHHAQPTSPKAITPGLVMHAQFTPLPGAASPIAGSFVDEDDSIIGETLGEFYDAGEGDDDRDPDDEHDEFGGGEEELESLTDATAVDDDIDIEGDEPGDPAIDAHFFGQRKRSDKAVDVMSIVFSGPMLCCEDENFD